MKNKILLIIVVFLIFVYYLERSFIKETSFFINEEENNYNETLENYVIGVVAGEMPASFDDEALKAQGIAARTFVIYKASTNENYDPYLDSTSQHYITVEDMHDKWKDDFDTYYEKVYNAVISTQNLIMTYEDKPISSYYFSMSNGYTEDAINVFNEDKEYLKTVIVPEEENNKNYEVTNVFTIDEFKKLLNVDSVNIGNITYDDTGRVKDITIDNKTFTGIEIRKLLKLRSTDFSININDNVEITTKGYGHGVGMSQYGANTLAKNGYSYEEILKYFYQNIEIESII